MRAGWSVLGRDADLRVAMFKEGDWLYEEAKRLALTQLREHIAPYLARIEELENDLFRVTGALPPFRAWSRNYGKTQIVTAKTKKRAMELIQASRYSFDNDWSECSQGDWWYRLAHEEAVWGEHVDVHGAGNGSFYRSLTPEEAEAILQQHIGAYLTVELLDLVNDERTDTGVSAAGTPYKITTSVWISYADNSKLHVQCRMDDGFDLHWHRPVSIERQNPQWEAARAGEWKTDGF